MRLFAPFESEIPMLIERSWGNDHLCMGVRFVKTLHTKKTVIKLFFWLTRDLIKIAEKCTLWISHTKKTHVNIHNFHWTLFGVCVVLCEVFSFYFGIQHIDRWPVFHIPFVSFHLFCDAKQCTWLPQCWHRINNLICCMYETSCVCVWDIAEIRFWFDANALLLRSLL